MSLGLDQELAAAARVSLTAPQMQRRLGGQPLTNKMLLSRLLAMAPSGASAAPSGGASGGASGASTGESPGVTGLVSGFAAAIEPIQRGRLRGHGLPGTPEIVHLASCFRA